jgi:hypothetical protein
MSMSTASFQLASLRLNMPLAQLASLFRPSLPVSGQLDNTAPASMGKMVFIFVYSLFWNETGAQCMR